MKVRTVSLSVFPARRVIQGSVLLILLVLVAACGAAAPSQERSAESAGAPAPTYAAPAEPGMADASGEAASSVEDLLTNASAQAQTSRVIIYTGQVELVVRDTQEAIADITELAAAQGGYVSGSNVYQSNDVPRGSITIRIPAETYQATMGALRALAVRVERESSNSQDVTEEFTDLQARQANLEVTEAALQELLVERQRTGSTSDILEVYRELTNIRGQIEQIEGRLRFLANQAALSTITIELIPDVLSQPVSVAGWEPQGVAKEALQALVVALQGLTNLTIWLVIFGLPLIVVLLIPLVLVVSLVRWWWRRYRANHRQRVTTVEAAPADPE